MSLHIRMLITVEWTGKHGSEPQNNRIAYTCTTIINGGRQTFHQVGYQPPLKTPLDSRGVLFEVEKNDGSLHSYIHQIINSLHYPFI